MVCDWYRVRCPHVTLSSHNAEEVIRFVWACASLTLSRRMLSLRQATVVAGAQSSRVPSPRSTPQPRRDMFKPYRHHSGHNLKNGWGGGEEIELGRVEIHRFG
jgi:hypothetical protein